MIEVKANLLRGSTFLAGETIEYSLIFTYPNNTNVESRSSRDAVEVLAWASAQIHCQCTVSEARVRLPKSPLPTQAEVVTATNGSTSFLPNRGERGMCVFSSVPKILFCDLQLSPGESKKYIYRETLPMDAPPSYKGQAVKYSYKITIGTQRVNSPIKLLRVPLRVLVVNGILEMKKQSEEQEPVTPSNPFLQEEEERPVLEKSMQILQCATSRRGPNYYNITNARGKVCKFCLFRSSYRLGEDIVGTFDFTVATIPCVQFSVTLQSEEVVSDEYCCKAGQGCTTISYTKHHDFCLHTNKTYMALPIPLQITPGFVTDIVALKWKLHFEFVTATQPLETHPIPADQSESSTWRGPIDMQVETMVWDMPINIYATNPLQASCSATAGTTANFVVF
ncbi:PREDICTED: RAB6A-GEF complex partner protein 2-like isoform X2 [Priapulus caudatus]|uniref:RAB6A-GEF complex partner protein 2-like isoform X2 n=1 Tax=Priapulus caudatus TaxID=37621 RepID=A0ABM1DQN7_PRICU|nr:PREDICTED: RAB6A-GEF complex partner protein 2-like isoform X2 [Priapulus caudatus]